jgi:hypothetical protein
LRLATVVAAARVALEAVVALRPGQAEVGHVDLPALPGIARGFRTGRADRGAEQGPLGAVVPALIVHEVGSQVPPLDAEIRMSAVVGRELEPAARFGLAVALGGLRQDREIRAGPRWCFAAAGAQPQCKQCSQ